MIDFAVNHVCTLQLIQSSGLVLNVKMSLNQPKIVCAETILMLEQEDYVQLINRVQLHGCRLSYCLKIILLNVARCRFGYPMTLKGFEEKMKSADGKEFLDEILRTIDFEAGGCFEFGKLMTKDEDLKVLVLNFVL